VYIRNIAFPPHLSRPVRTQRLKTLHGLLLPQVRNGETLLVFIHAFAAIALRFQDKTQHRTGTSHFCTGLRETTSRSYYPVLIPSKEQDLVRYLLRQAFQFCGHLFRSRCRHINPRLRISHELLCNLIGLTLPYSVPLLTCSTIRKIM
jgi:hypothetical protein